VRAAARRRDKTTPPAGAPPLLSDGGYRTNKASDLFTDTRVLEAQRYLIHELVGYFGPHPALYAWELGEALFLDMMGLRAILPKNTSTPERIGALHRGFEHCNKQKGCCCGWWSRFRYCHRIRGRA
jgi:hypothetical protein